MAEAVATELVKVQRPLASNDPHPLRQKCLVYNRDRSRQSVQDVPDWAWSVLQTRAKIWCWARWRDRSFRQPPWQLVSLAEDREF